MKNFISTFIIITVASTISHAGEITFEPTIFKTPNEVHAGVNVNLTNNMQVFRLFDKPKEEIHYLPRKVNGRPWIVEDKSKPIKVQVKGFIDHLAAGKNMIVDKVDHKIITGALGYRGENYTFH